LQIGRWTHLCVSFFLGEVGCWLDGKVGERCLFAIVSFAFVSLAVFRGLACVVSWIRRMTSFGARTDRSAR
jgi:hypothetical protein